MHHPEQPVSRRDRSSWQTLLEPRAPADARSFSDLAGSYNLLTISAYARVFANLILGEVRKRPGRVRTLDVGCGRGIAREVGFQWAIRDAVTEYWGLEVDESVPEGEGLFDHHEHALLEDATLPENYFDIVYSSMVMEHVDKVDDFLAALFRCLKPGGSYLCVTPNGRSFVPFLSRVLNRLRLDEFVLPMLQGKKKTHDYHYPLYMRFNRPRDINLAAERAGFTTPEYAFVQGTGIRTYFPGPLRPFYHLLVLQQRMIKDPRSLATVICRMTKPVPALGSTEESRDAS